MDDAAGLSAIAPILFARMPDQGQVKTRLAASIGDVTALRVYQWLARRQATALNDSGLPWQLWVTPGNRKQEALEWLPGAASVRDQGEGDLGQRLTRAVDAAFQGGCRGVVLLGTDCPDLDAETLRQLAGWAANGYFALVPAMDGGYAGFALPRNYPPAFKGIDWSTSWVMTQTVAALQRGGHQAILMHPMRDCDTLADLQDIAARHPDCPYSGE